MAAKKFAEDGRTSGEGSKEGSEGNICNSLKENTKFDDTSSSDSSDSSDYEESLANKMIDEDAFGDYDLENEASEFQYFSDDPTTIRKMKKKP
eukprot:CAMPEP_0114578298 /NCGR_PEP_ID=MMETSP0125-20121206/2859_1 /TAXON_ID=485358 ORGANISM="Aristerostoma sp., Strain ATCC 50986" /NCGR_SAMPLE_ID=MMETSP0125 /ASSEMBLY_ACC=CAM_ASM_000245 /LENGTH=92 /DNA_ID=CAMNT_0001768271 /DNA_START=160 /DNA_END=438 /DNA_ORIENTATION=-